MGDAVTGVTSGVGETTKGMFSSREGGDEKLILRLCSCWQVCGGYDRSWGKECAGGEEMIYEGLRR